MLNFLVENRITEPAIYRKVTKASDLKIVQLVLIKNHQKGPINPTYIYDHWVAGIPNESPVLLTKPDGREKKCNIHHDKPVSSLDVTTHGHSSNVELPTGAFHSPNPSEKPNPGCARTSLVSIFALIKKTTKQHTNI